MLPISASDIVELRPATDRVTAAQSALQKAQEENGEKRKASEEMTKAKAELEAAQKSQAAHDPVYKLRVPTERSRAFANRDIQAEGVIIEGNPQLLIAILSHADRLPPDDLSFIQALQAKIDESERIPVDDWPRVHDIARRHPRSARIIADRNLHSNLARLHLIRHYLIIDGEHSPLTEAKINELTEKHPTDALAIGLKISELLVVGSDTAKN